MKQHFKINALKAKYDGFIFFKKRFFTFFINSSCFLKRSDALSMANNSIFISFVNGRFFVIQYENPVIFKSLILTHDGDKVQKLPKVGHF